MRYESDRREQHYENDRDYYTGPKFRHADDTPLSTGAYFGYLILFSIPIIGWIFAIIKAFGESNINLRNFARAELIVLIINIVISIFVISLILIPAGIGSSWKLI